MYEIDPVLGLEPAVDALGVENVVADRDLADRNPVTELFEADDALQLHELVDFLVVGLLLDKLEQLAYAHLILKCCLSRVHGPHHVRPKVQAQVPHHLVLDHLLTELPFPDTQSYDCANADAYECHHEHKEDERDNSEDCD